MIKADELLANAPGKAFIADAGYDSNRFRQAIRDKKKRDASAHRHALREDSAELPRTRPGRMRMAMACTKLGDTALGASPLPKIEVPWGTSNFSFRLAPN